MMQVCVHFNITASPQHRLDLMLRQPGTTTKKCLRSAGTMAALPPPSEQRALLVGELNWRKGNDWSTSYTFDKNLRDGNWIECIYGDGAIATLSKRLDAGVKECVITVRKAKKSTVKIVCH
jgi:hypothetical protein